MSHQPPCQPKKHSRYRWVHSSPARSASNPWHKPSLWVSSHVLNGSIATMHIWLRFTSLMRVYHVENTVIDLDLDISGCMGSTASRQASVSSRLQGAFAFQSWMGTERHMSMLGNLYGRAGFLLVYVGQTSLSRPGHMFLLQAKHLLESNFLFLLRLPRGYPSVQFKSDYQGGPAKPKYNTASIWCMERASNLFVSNWGDPLRISLRTRKSTWRTWTEQESTLSAISNLNGEHLTLPTTPSLKPARPYHHKCYLTLTSETKNENTRVSINIYPRQVIPPPFPPHGPAPQVRWVDFCRLQYLQPSFAAKTPLGVAEPWDKTTKKGVGKRSNWAMKKGPLVSGFIQLCGENKINQ